MATKNLSDYDVNKVPDGADMRIGIVVSEWNQEITFALRDGAVNTLIKHGVKEENIVVDYVPGTFELTYAGNLMVNSDHFDSVIVLGCVIRGETPHFDYVCQGVTQGITAINATSDIPVIFGVLTTENQQQAIDRAGGKLGNKGDECAITAIKMINFSDKYLEV